MNYKWTFEIEIDPDVVADGLALDAEKLHFALCRAFPFARMGGIGVEALSAPDPAEIRKEQGYDS